MTAPSAASLAKFIAAPPSHMAGFLFYGSDASQISANADAVIQVLASRDAQAEVIRLHEDDIAADPERIIVELATGSLFGGRKIIRLMSLPTKAHATLLNAIAQPISEAWLIVQASDLRKSHKVTQAFEAAASLAAIACYGEDRAALPSLIRQQLSASGYDIDPEALPLIAARANFLAAIAKSETDKLISFMGNTKRVTVSDVEACLGDQQAGSVQETLDAALEGNGRAALLAFERLASSDQNFTPLLAACSTTLQRLHALKAAVDGGTPLSQAIRDARPPIFFKQQDAVARQTRLWSTDALVDFLKRSNETVKETRLRPQLAENITRNFLLDVAKAGRQFQKGR